MTRPIQARVFQLRGYVILDFQVKVFDFLVDVTRNARAQQFVGLARHVTHGGEKAQRLHLLVVWRETDLFTPREKAALAYAESVTRVAETHVPDADYEEAARHFNERELVDLTLLIATMNAWNRVAISFRQGPPVRRLTDA